MKKQCKVLLAGLCLLAMAPLHAAAPVAKIEAMLAKPQ